MFITNLLNIIFLFCFNLIRYIPFFKYLKLNVFVNDVSELINLPSILKTSAKIGILFLKLLFFIDIIPLLGFGIIEFNILSFSLFVNAVTQNSIVSVKLNVVSEASSILSNSLFTDKYPFP